MALHIRTQDREYVAPAPPAVGLGVRSLCFEIWGLGFEDWSFGFGVRGEGSEGLSKWFDVKGLG